VSKGRDTIGTLQSLTWRTALARKASRVLPKVEAALAAAILQF